MDIVIRALLVYVVVFLLMRISGKRQFSELGPFDFVILLILSEGVSQSLYGGEDYSLTAGFLIVGTLIGFDILLSYLKRWVPWLDIVMEGAPVVLVESGVPQQKALKAERVDEGDVLESARRTFGIERMDQIRYAILEKGGSISIIPEYLPYNMQRH